MAQGQKDKVQEQAEVWVVIMAKVEVEAKDNVSEEPATEVEAKTWVKVTVLDPEHNKVEVKTTICYELGK